MRKVIVGCLLIVASLVVAQSPSTAQWSQWTSAVALHKLGFDIEFINGNPITGSRYLQWLCFWSCVPYLDTPADIANWPAGRVKRTGVARVNLPNQPEGCANAGPEAIMKDGTVQFRCLDGRRFIPAVGDIGKFLAGLDELKAGKINGK